MGKTNKATNGTKAAIVLGIPIIYMMLSALIGLFKDFTDNKIAHAALIFLAMGFVPYLYARSIGSLIVYVIDETKRG